MKAGEKREDISPTEMKAWIVLRDQYGFTIERFPETASILEQLGLYRRQQPVDDYREWELEDVGPVV